MSVFALVGEDAKAVRGGNALRFGICEHVGEEAESDIRVRRFNGCIRSCCGSRNPARKMYGIRVYGIRVSIGGDRRVIGATARNNLGSIRGVFGRFLRPDLGS